MVIDKVGFSSHCLTRLRAACWTAPAQSWWKCKRSAAARHNGQR
jgi:hypothetical protein